MNHCHYTLLLKGFFKSALGAENLQYVNSYGWKSVYYPARMITKTRKPKQGSMTELLLKRT